MISWLFDTSQFLLRDVAERWPLWLAVLWQVQNGITAFSYAVIGIYLIWMWSNSRRLMLMGRNTMLWLGIVFLMCSWVRTNEVLAFHWPAYHLFAVVGFSTALMAAITAIKLPSVVIFFVRAAQQIEEQNGGGIESS